MITPAPADLEIARRVPLLLKADTLDEAARGDVVGLEIRFEAVQVKRAKGISEGQLQSFGHKALPGERCADPVAEVGALEAAATDLTQLDRPKDRVIGAPTDEQFDLRRRPAASAPRGERRWRGWRCREPAVERATPSGQGQELSGVCPRREREVDP